MENIEIRTKIFTSGLKHYQVADMLGIAETTFCRWLRTPLDSEKKEKILSVLENV